jgi:UDP-glucose 4-epimerase
MVKVLITGAGGYIGQHLSMALLDAGWEVRGLSRRPRPDRFGMIRWVLGDVRDAEVVGQAIDGCAAVVHLACLPRKQSAKSVMEALHVNIGGTLQILEAARKARVERLVYTSTGLVYGGHSPLPNSELHRPEPDSPYAATKLCGEVLCQAYARVYGMPIQVLRLFNVYGAAADCTPRHTVEAIFLRQLRQGKRPQVRGHPGSGRDFIHVRDVVRAICLALARPAWEGAVNIGTGVFTTISDLAHTAARVLGQTTEPEIVETDELPVRFQAETTRAHVLLSFWTEVDLETGLRQLAIDL